MRVGPPRQPSPSIAAQKQGRPPSPLRNGYVPDTFTGIEGHGDAGDDDDEDDDEDDTNWRSPSPTSSVSQFAANIAQRVGSFVGSMGTRSSPLPTDAELEAEAERERDRSRREAERILTQEAEERRLVEERVLAMMHNSRSDSPKSLPPPPARAQTLPNTPSPSASQKESGPSWWTAAKNRLTPTKEPLTPAQQIIQEAKAREKDKKSSKGKEKEWPSSAQSKHQDPAYLNLTIPAAPPQRRPPPSSPSSPTPSRPQSSGPPMLTPSPMRSSTASSTSPSNEPPLLYAQFNAQGTLDIPGTLLAIAKRFEKLEKWTVSHVRALEDRMSDVEKWLVEKEKEKQSTQESQAQESQARILGDVRIVRDEVTELQGRVGQLGRELAKLATSPETLSAAPSSQTAPVLEPAPTATPQVARPLPDIVPQTPRLGSTTARQSTSPPMTSTKSSRTRLPYPSGDYAPPSDAVVSPSPSSPSSVHSATRPISGLPPAGLGTHQQPPSTTTSPNGQTSTQTALPVPKSTARRPQDISPTPRKRYTVALGGPITNPSELSSWEREPRSRSPLPRHRLTDDDGNSNNDDDDDSEDHKDVFQDETIGKSAAARLAQAANGNKNTKTSTSPQSSPPAPRIRAQSVYGLSSLHSQSLAAPAPNPLRLRTRSTERIGLGFLDNDMHSLVSPSSGNRFIDPLVIRKQEKEKEAVKIAMPAPARGKVAVNQLVAFFDGDK